MSAAVEVPVHLPTLLWPCTGGRSRVLVQSETIRGCIDRLVEEYPLLRVHLFDERGALREHIHLFWNDDNLAWRDDWNEPVKSGDELTVLQAVSGG